MEFSNRYRHTKIGGLPDLIDVVISSATVNVAQAVGNMDGTVIVPTYDWTSCLAEHVGKCVGIKALHNLRFPSTHKGHVFVREKSDSPELAVKLLKDEWSPLATDLPEHVSSSGLSLSRQWYLYNKIREFCPQECKDQTCPEPCGQEPPSIPPSSSAHTTTHTTSSISSVCTTTSFSNSSSSNCTSSSNSSSSNTTSSADATPQPKRPRLCGVCKGSGHNSRSCPSKL